MKIFEKRLHVVFFLKPHILFFEYIEEQMGIKVIKL
jgi:hypothetical protein